jgi:hypothetical protein
VKEKNRLAGIGGAANLGPAQKREPEAADLNGAGKRRAHEKPKCASRAVRIIRVAGDLFRV